MEGVTPEGVKERQTWIREGVQICFELRKCETRWTKGADNSSGCFPSVGR